MTTEVQEELFSLEAVGQRPTLQELSFKGLLPFADEIRKGDKLKATVWLRADQVAFVDKYDKQTGALEQTTRRVALTVEDMQLDGEPA